MARIRNSGGYPKPMSISYAQQNISECGFKLIYLDQRRRLVFFGDKEDLPPGRYCELSTRELLELKD